MAPRQDGVVLPAPIRGVPEDDGQTALRLLRRRRGLGPRLEPREEGLLSLLLLLSLYILMTTVIIMTTMIIIIIIIMIINVSVMIMIIFIIFFMIHDYQD